MIRKKRVYLVLSIVVASLSVFVGSSCDEESKDKAASQVDQCGNDVIVTNDSFLGSESCTLVTHDSNCKEVMLSIDCDTKQKILNSSPTQAQSITNSLRHQNGVSGFLRAKQPGLTSAAKPAATGSTNSLVQYLQKLLPLSFEFFSAAPSTASTFTCDPTLNFYGVEHEYDTVSHEFPCTAPPFTHIPVVSRPLQAAITPDSTELWVTSYDQGITIISTATDQILQTIHTNQNTFPSGIAISPDGTRVYVTSFIDFAPALITYNRATRAEIARVALPTEYPQSVFLTPDGSTAIVTHSLDDAVELIDTLSNTVIATAGIGQPYGVAFSPNGNTAYFTSWPNSVVAVDMAALKQTAAYKVGLEPVDIRVSSNGRWITTANSGDGTVSEVDTFTGTVNSISVGGTPHGLSFVN